MNQENRAHHQRILKENMARLNFATEIHARRMEHEAKYPNRKFRLFPRNALPHLRDASDTLSSADPTPAMNDDGDTKKMFSQTFPSPTTGEVRSQRPATSELRLNPFQITREGKRFSEQLAIPGTTRRPKSRGSMRPAANGYNHGDRYASFDNGFRTSDSQSSLDSPSTPPGAAMYRVTGSNYAKALKKYGHLTNSKRIIGLKKKGLCDESNPDEQCETIDRMVVHGQQDQQQESIDSLSVATLLADQQRTLQKLESLEKEMLEEKNGRLQVQKELQDLKQLLTSTLNASSQVPE